MSRIALFPGSFDPITIGHVDVITRSLDLFDKIIIGVGHNTTKQYMFPLQDRVVWIRNSFSDYPQISVESYSGLTVDFCKKVQARFILRGLRTSADFEFERAIAQMNHYLERGIETIFLLSSPQYAPVSSTIIRDIIRNGGNAQPFVADGVILK
ncbi:MAG: pantetheine-phosphate adenylyltransferase [Bacteroidia bacterium]|nr:pantetheine-phosphate adenylyltransferase [Bacteroidota bacterium]MBP9083775.1 pantetheine-phosphate adenylyltransferase [Bacteroidia bacterium]